MITQNGHASRYISYLYGKVKNRFSFLEPTCNMEQEGDCAKIAFCIEGAYCPYVRKFAEENIADVITVGYKYDFFKNYLRLPLLTQKQKRLLCTAIVAADYKEDRAHAFKRISSQGEYCIDGMYNFRLKSLKARWQEIAEYIPADMSEISLDGFLEFLTEDGEEIVYLKDGKACDKDYRPLSKSALTGEESLVGEIILSGAAKVYGFGEIDGETTRFLRKYYGKNAVFC